MGNGWAVLLAFPEAATHDDIDALRAMEALEADFAVIGCKVIGCIMASGPDIPGRDSVTDDFDTWTGQIRKYMGDLPPFPIVRQAEPGFPLLPSAEASLDLETRTLVVVGPDKRIKLVIAIPVVTASMFGEILRLVESLQYAAERRSAKPGCGPDDIIVLPCAPANEDVDRSGRSKCGPVNGRRRELLRRKRCG